MKGAEAQKFRVGGAAFPDEIVDRRYLARTGGGGTDQGAYVEYLEEQVGCVIRYVSVGADRDQYLVGVGLHDPHCFVQPPPRNPRPNGGVGRQGGRGRGVGVDAVVDIPQGPQLGRGASPGGGRARPDQAGYPLLPFRDPRLCPVHGGGDGQGCKISHQRASLLVFASDIIA